MASEKGIEKPHLVMLTLFFVFLFYTGVMANDKFTWILEVFPALMALAALTYYYRRFVFTDLVLWLILVHCAILMWGGEYTYAENPLFNWIKETFSLQRNYYDRLGHFFQGFVPALITREVLIRNGVLKPGGWLFTFVLSFCLAVSAFYEFIEWWVALATGEGAAAFLGTQGDVWDTQWDMFMAFTGAILAQVLFSKTHDRLIGEKVKSI